MFVVVDSSVGAETPLGNDPPFLRTKPSVGVASVLLAELLFMLLIMSRTELFLEDDAVLVSEAF